MELNQPKQEKLQDDRLHNVDEKIEKIDHLIGGIERLTFRIAGLILSILVLLTVIWSKLISLFL